MSSNDRQLDKKREEEISKSMERLGTTRNIRKMIDYTGKADFLERNQGYLRLIEKRQAEYEQLRRFKDDEIVPYDFKPQINQDIQLNRTVDDLFKWKEQVERKREMQRKANAIETPKSAERVKGKQVHTEERWVELQKKKSVKPVSPIRGDARNVSDRLYDYSKVYEKKRREREQKLYSGLFYPATNRHIKRTGDLSVEPKSKSVRVIVKSPFPSPISQPIGDHNRTAYTANHGIRVDSQKAHINHDSTGIDLTTSFAIKPDNRDRSRSKEIIDRFETMNITSVTLNTMTRPSFTKNVTDYNREFGTQTSHTFFDDMAIAESIKEFGKFTRDAPSLRNKILDALLEKL